MFNKLHNGNTEALPLIRKEKTIAVVILAFVFDQTVDTAAFRQRCFPALRYMVRQSSYFVTLLFSKVKIKDVLVTYIYIQMNEDCPTVNYCKSLPFQTADGARMCECVYDGHAEMLPNENVLKDMI